MPTCRPSSCHGGAWYAGYGTEKSRGTKVFALAGAIKNSGLVEVPVGMPLGDLIYDIGGGTSSGKEFKAAQMGGPVRRLHPQATPQRALGLRVALRARRDHGLRRPHRHGRGQLHGRRGPLLPRIRSGRVVRQVRSLPRGHQAHARDPQPHLRRPRRGSRRRPPHRTGRNDQGHVVVRAGPDRVPTRCFRPSAISATNTSKHIRDKHCRAGVCPSLVNAPCSSACPANVDIPGYVSLVAEKRYAEALRLHRERNPFAAVCSRGSASTRAKTSAAARRSMRRSPSAASSDSWSTRK